MPHARQSTPDSGLGFQVKPAKPFMLFPLKSFTLKQQAGRAGVGGDIAGPFNTTELEQPNQIKLNLG